MRPIQSSAQGCGPCVVHHASPQSTITHLLGELCHCTLRCFIASNFEPRLGAAQHAGRALRAGESNGENLSRPAISVVPHQHKHDAERSYRGAACCRHSRSLTITSHYLVRRYRRRVTVDCPRAKRASTYDTTLWMPVRTLRGGQDNACSEKDVWYPVHPGGNAER